MQLDSTCTSAFRLRGIKPTVYVFRRQAISRMCAVLVNRVFYACNLFNPDMILIAGICRSLDAR
jgi:hypothetical protein